MRDRLLAAAAGMCCLCSGVQLLTQLQLSTGACGVLLLLEAGHCRLSFCSNFAFKSALANCLYIWETIRVPNQIQGTSSSASSVFLFFCGCV